MSAEEVNINAVIAHVGETLAVVAGEAIPERVLVPGVLMGISDASSASLLRLRTITGEGNGRTLAFSDLTVRGTRTYLLRELDAIRPLAFVLPGRSWRSLTKFVENGLYQAWPNGRLFRVRNGHLMDPFRASWSVEERDRRFLPALIPVFIERWIPPVVAEPVAQEEEEL